MDNLTIHEYIKTEENNYNTTRIPITNSKDWSMKEHIERCTNVANGWFHSGKNDGLRPYDDIVTPIIDVAFRTEGFDVKDIVPYVDDVKNFYKSFLIKKYHPQWAREHNIDDFIDEVVESSVIYDLVLIKNANNERPEVVPLQEIAFCDQTDILSGPICIKHQYSIPELLEFKGKWDDNKIEEAIVMASTEKEVSNARDNKVKTPSKYIEVYELHGTFPEDKIKEGGDPNNYVPQLHIVTYYTDKDGNKEGITLYKGKSKKFPDLFKALKIDKIRSFGRACGRSIVERLFEPQVWSNYAGIKLKEMLDSAVNLLQTDSDEVTNQKISGLKNFTVLKTENGKSLGRVDMQLQNVPALDNYKAGQELNARKLGSASDAQLGQAPASGTPFALQNAIIQQGEGIHEYRRGKIATFFSDELYRDWILKWLVADMNNGKDFSEELSLEELQQVSKAVITNEVNRRIKENILDGLLVTPEMIQELTQIVKNTFSEGGNRRFFKIIKKELDNLPIKVKINVAGKQKNMSQIADKMSNLISNVLRNPQAFATIPGLGGLYNQLIENSGLNPIDFTPIIEGAKAQAQAQQAQPLKQLTPLSEGNKNNKKSK